MNKHDDNIVQISIRYQKLEFVLDERMRRLYAAVEASVLGHGGITIVAKATGISRRAIHVGMAELEAGQTKPNSQKQRIRKEGGGRKPLLETETGVLKALES